MGTALCNPATRRGSTHWNTPATWSKNSHSSRNSMLVGQRWDFALCHSVEQYRCSYFRDCTGLLAEFISSIVGGTRGEAASARSQRTRETLAKLRSPWYTERRRGNGARPARCTGSDCNLLSYSKNTAQNTTRDTT